jgi:hypothetical protein
MKLEILPIALGVRAAAVLLMLNAARSFHGGATKGNRRHWDATSRLQSLVSRGEYWRGGRWYGAVVAADELLNVPHLELETTTNFAKAKIKEAILEVTGG